jgi:hypothetical protein
MPRHIQDGAYYEFRRQDSHSYYEVGPQISERNAILDVRYKKDVYTPRGSDAKSLAKHVHKAAPVWHPAHEPNYFPHYYPGGSLDYGHIFYGGRGEDFER